MFSRNFMKAFPVKKYARQSAAGKHFNKQSRNHQYWLGHVGIKRSHPLQNRNLHLRFTCYVQCLLWIRLLLRGHQTRSWTTCPRCNIFIDKRLGKIAFPNQLKAPTTKSSRTGTKSTKSKTGSKPFNQTNDSFILSKHQFIFIFMFFFCISIDLLH